MALSATEKRSLRRAFPSRKVSKRLIDVIDGGASAALSVEIEHGINVAFGSKTKAAAFIANLENGTATTGATQKRLGRVLGRERTASGVCDEVDALT